MSIAQLDVDIRIIATPDYKTKPVKQMEDDNSNKFDHIQDVLGQLTSLNTYTHMALGFLTDKEPEALAQKLQSAAKQLVWAFSFLGGHVIRRGASPERTGLATVVPYPTSDKRSIVIFKDCQQLCPSMQITLAAGVPMTMLDGDILVRRKGGPDHYAESKEAAPVLEIQANFIQGGLVVVFQGNHNIMDMNGMGYIIEMYAKALRGEPFTQTEVEMGNQDRRNIVRLLDPDKLPDMSKYMPITGVAASSRLEIQASSFDVRWAYFHVSASSLATLKSAASKPPGQPHNAMPVPWITTDDALSAWLCQRILIARLKRLPKIPKATICRAVNARRFLQPPISKEYTGHAVTCAYTEVALDDLLATSDLSGLAHQMRADVMSISSHDIQSFATKLNSLDNKGELSFGARLDLTAFDLTLSSWSALGVGNIEFGTVLGQPSFAKRPRLDPIESIIYLMPKTPEGHIDVACCLRNSDIIKLQQDAEFVKYGRYIG